MPILQKRKPKGQKDHSSKALIVQHSSFFTLAWKIPWMEEPGGLQSMESLRVRHDCAIFTFTLFFGYLL